MTNRIFCVKRNNIWNNKNVGQFTVLLLIIINDKF